LIHGKVKINLYISRRIPNVKKTLIITLLTVFTGQLYAQLLPKFIGPKKYSQREVYDSAYGINIYEKLNANIGGDSVRNDKKGYASQGWVEDQYESGKTLHKGYYVDGTLRIYKNFYENGKPERSFKVNDLKRCTMVLYYSDSTLKSEINYYNGQVQKEQDYYPNGKLEYVEESEKNMIYLVQRKSYLPDGKPESIFELTDPKKKIYTKKEYYPNGNIKEEGTMAFDKGSIDYRKDGKWKVYDEKGKVTEEFYINGELNEKGK